jgi:hypothetical protein
MILKIFKNGKGILYGEDKHSITSSVQGDLYIGSAHIRIEANKPSPVPSLLNGNGGVQKGTFISGKTYDLGKITIRGGRVVSPSADAIEMAELRARVDDFEEKIKKYDERMNSVLARFESDALGFLIK